MMGGWMFARTYEGTTKYLYNENAYISIYCTGGKNREDI